MYNTEIYDGILWKKNITYVFHIGIVVSIITCKRIGLINDKHKYRRLFVGYIQLNISQC